MKYSSTVIPCYTDAKTPYLSTFFKQLSNSLGIHVPGFQLSPKNAVEFSWPSDLEGNSKRFTRTLHQNQKNDGLSMGFTRVWPSDVSSKKNLRLGRIAPQKQSTWKWTAANPGQTSTGDQVKKPGWPCLLGEQKHCLVDLGGILRFNMIQCYTWRMCYENSTDSKHIFVGHRFGSWWHPHWLPVGACLKGAWQSGISRKAVTFLANSTGELGQMVGCWLTNLKNFWTPFCLRDGKLNCAPWTSWDSQWGKIRHAQFLCNARTGRMANVVPSIKTNSSAMSIGRWLNHNIYHIISI